MDLPVIAVVLVIVAVIALLGMAAHRSMTVAVLTLVGSAALLVAVVVADADQLRSLQLPTNLPDLRTNDDPDDLPDEAPAEESAPADEDDGELVPDGSEPATPEDRAPESGDGSIGDGGDLHGDGAGDTVDWPSGGLGTGRGIVLP